jgi:hypothetical protein
LAEKLAKINGLFGKTDFFGNSGKHDHYSWEKKEINFCGWVLLANKF